jgi:hypothetical protein
MSSDAEWAEKCTKTLVESVALGQTAGAADWKKQRAELTDQEHIRIWNLNLSNKDLKDFDFSRCKFSKVKFIGATLVRSSFEQSILRECNFTHAKLMGTNLRGADLKTSILRDVEFDKKTNFSIMKGRLPEDADLVFEERAKTAWAREEFDRDLSRGTIYRKLVKAIDYGDNLRRLLAFAVIVIGLFALLFWIAGPAGTPWWRAPVYSLQYFVALSDPWAERCFALSTAGTLESCLGLVFLALLLSSITKQLVLTR